MIPKPKGPLIAVLENVPERWYLGATKSKKYAQSKLARHSVLVAIAKYANRDGKNVWASVARIAHTARVAPSSAREAIRFFVDEGRLLDRGEHPLYGTNVYDLVLPTQEDAEEAERERAEAPQKERARTRQRVAKSRQKAACNAGTGATVTPVRALCNTDTGDDLSFHLSSLSVRERGGQASLPPKDAAKDKSAEDYEWLAVRMAQNAWPINRQTEQLVRSYLKEGRSKEDILKAIKSTMNAMPEGERQPGLHLAQNMDAHMKLIGSDIAVMTTTAGRAFPPLPRSDR